MGNYESSIQNFLTVIILFYWYSLQIKKLLQSVYIPFPFTSIYMYLFDFETFSTLSKPFLKILPPASRALLVYVTQLLIVIDLFFGNSVILPPTNWEGLKRTHYNCKKK